MEWFRNLKGKLSRAIWLRRLRSIEQGTRRHLSRLYLQQRIQESEAPMTLTDSQNLLLQNPALQWSSQEQIPLLEDLQMTSRKLITELTKRD